MEPCKHEEECVFPERTITPSPLPTDGGGGGGGSCDCPTPHRVVSTLPTIGVAGVEYIIMKDTADCSTFEGSAVWNPTGKCWVTTSGSGDGAKYVFENVEDDDGKVIGWKVKEDGKDVFTYTDQGGKSDGAYLSIAPLTIALNGISTIKVTDIPGLDVAKIVPGETYIYDANGTLGRVDSYDDATNTVKVTTMTISPGERQGVRLGAVDEQADLPLTVASAVAAGYTQPVIGDFMYVRDYNGKLAEFLVQNIDATTGAITWTFDHYLNAGDYVVDIYENGATTPITKNSDGSVTLPKFVKGIRKHDGTLLSFENDSTVKLPEIPEDYDNYRMRITGKNLTTKPGTTIKIRKDRVSTINSKGQTLTVADFLNDVKENRDIVYLQGTDGLNQTNEAILWYTGETDTELEFFVLVDTKGGRDAEKFNVWNITSGTLNNIAGSAGQIISIPKSALTTINLKGSTVPMAQFLLDVTANRDIIYIHGTKDGVITQELAVWFSGSDTDNVSFYVLDDLKAGGGAGGNVTYNLNRDGQELLSASAIIGSGTTSDNWRAVANTRIPFTNRAGSTLQQTAPGTWVIPPKTKVLVTMSLGLTGPAGITPNGEWCVKDTADPFPSSMTQLGTILRVDAYDMQRVSTGNEGSWALNGTASGVFYNDTTSPKTIEALCINSQVAGTLVYAVTSQITVVEIGRVVDPVAYLDNGGDAQDMPVGSILQHFGKTAPAHYLVADGTTYNIGDYPQLEAFIVEQFGTVNHFGGNGTTTWAVPNLQGEFLRGAGENNHTNPNTKVKEGDGASVGEHQAASALRNIWHYDDSAFPGKAIWYSDNAAGINGNLVTSEDSKGPQSTHSLSLNSDNQLGENVTNHVYMTTRPTNTSVLMCIKCEATPKVIVEQGMYKVTCPATFVPKNNEEVMFTLDEAHATEDTSMVDGAHNQFVIPETGYYVITVDIPTQKIVNGSSASVPVDSGYALKIRKDDLEWISDRGDLVGFDNNNGYWSKTMTAVRKLTVGDILEVRLILPDVTPLVTTPLNATVTIAMVNCTDRDTANVMLKPNLWTPGVEQSFGDGVFGMRIKGVTPAYTSRTGGERHNFNIGSFPASTRFIQSGGNALVSGEWDWPMGMAWGGGPATAADDGKLMFAISVYLDTTTATFWLSVQNTQASPGDQYDVWVLYTK